MPFVSENQRKYCWVKYYNDIKNGNIPDWDCNEWEHSSPKKSPKRSKKKSLRKSLSLKKKNKSRSKSPVTRKIYIGPRGGKYIIFKGKKMYV